MEATRLQMQNFLIFLLDLVGVTVGYFAAVWLRFGNIETGYTVMGNDTYYRWFIAIVVLMMIYFLFRPNRGFFKRKFIEEMRMNLQTVILMAAGMAMVAFLIQDAKDYSRFIYIFTSGFSFVWMQITHRVYRKYWLSRRKDHSYARKMMIITTSDHAEEVIGNIMEEKNWDLWITSVAVVDKDMTGWLINEIPVVAHSYRSIFEYAMRSVVDEVFLYIPMDDEFPIAMTIQNLEDMGIKTNLNISQFQINENLERSLEKVGPYESVSFRSEKEIRQKKYAHLALFDDGILGSMTHLGTFGTELREAAGWAQAWTRKEEMEFVNCLTEDMPCGGEVVACTENDRMYEAKFIVNELKKMHITYLDSTHDMKALDLWKSISWDGFDNLKIWKGYSLYEYIGEHLGYRLVVRTVELKPIRRGRAEFMFEIENTGFGRVFQETELFLIMKNRNETREVPISMDMRKIQAGTRICGKTVIKLMEGRVSLKLQRKKDGRIIHFANKNSTDTLYLGSLHCGKIYLSEE